MNHKLTSAVATFEEIESTDHLTACHSHNLPLQDKFDRISDFSYNPLPCIQTV